MALISKLFPRKWNFTIRTKLTIIFTLLIGVISVFIFIFFPARLKHQATEAVIAKAQTIAEMTAYSVSPALFFEDIENIENVFKSARQNKDVVYIVLLNNSGETVAAFNKEKAEQANFAAAGNKSHVSKDGTLYNTMTSILHNGHKVGQLYLGLSLEKLRAEIKKSQITIAFVSLIIFVFGVSFVFGIGTIVTRPLSQMVKTVEQISRGDLTQRAVVSSRDEVGQLAASFNMMVDNLESTYRELENVNRTLENRVRERTKKLQQEINERRRAEEAMRESEKHLRTIVENMPVLMDAFDEEGKIIVWNRECERVTGYTANEIIGNPKASELLYPNEDYKTFILEQLAKYGNNFRNLEWEITCKDGSKKTILWSNISKQFPIPGWYSWAIGVDITELKRAEEALRRSEERYRTMIEHSNDMIWTLDAEGNFTYFNKRTEEFSGHRFENWRGKSFASLIVEEDLPIAMDAFQKALSGEPQHYELRVKKVDGDVLILSVNTAPILKAGKVVGTVSFGRDITDRKRLEEQLRQSQKMEAIGRLAGGVAHDFNNILTGIQGYVDLILMELKEDDPLYRDVKEIQRSAARAANLTRQLLLFSRRQPMKMIPLNLNTTIEDMMKMLDRLIGEDISITTDLTDALWSVNADPGTIEQVLMNLVVNARDAMPEGGKITIKTENVRVDKKFCRTYRHARPGKFVCLSVKDTGIGMDKMTLDRIFEPFFSTKSKSKGTGLGLSVVYGIVKEHEGWINVKSSPGKGAIFEIYLPAISTTAIPKQEASVPLEAFRGTGERILLVEDNEMVRKFSTKGLSENGYVVFAAANVQEALDIFNKEKGDFDLIFSDVVLSDERGPKLVDRLLKHRPEIGVLFASGYSTENSDWRIIREKEYPYLQKPYSLFELLKTVSDVLKKNYCGKKDENSLY